jgi:VCBS repeat protein
MSDPSSLLGRLGRLAKASLSTLALGSVHCGGPSSVGFSVDAGLGGDGPDPKLDGRALVLVRDGATNEAAPVDKCHVPPNSSTGNAPTCTAPPAPPNSFDPVIKWTWAEPESYAAGTTSLGSMVMPLVAEMVDTNGDGMVDLCDIPSVIVTVNGGAPHAPGYIFMLAGDTGAVQAVFDGQVDSSVTPALGDIDGDGYSEVVTNDPGGHLVIYDHMGHIKSTSPQILDYYLDVFQYCGAIAIYDLNGDGSPEIIEGFEVLDNMGNHLWSVDESAWDNQYYCPAMTAADLDGDGYLEVIFGNGAYHHDGSTYWTIDGPPGQPQVADFDGDGIPEIFVARQDGLLVLAHDGTQIIGPTQSFDPGLDVECWSKAGAVGDFDGTGLASIMDGSCNHFGIWHMGSSSLSLQWDQPIADPSGIASSTAFDLLGRGIADAIYGDEAHLWVYDGKTGALELKGNRSSGTLIEYPVVADVDNDGSADIVVVSNSGGSSGGVYSNTVEVFQEAQKRWAPTRRIWNQHAYSVTNVNEDGSIPTQMKESWKYLNTFRMNAQIQAGGECAPPPANPK